MTISLAHLTARLLDRDLATLMREVEAYPDDEGPWADLPGLPNATGTLVLHACGNLRHFVGHVLGGSGYTRDRDREFAARGLPRADLVAELEVTRREVQQALAARTDEALAAHSPVRIGEWTVQASALLVHLVSHLAYHLGQADVHRRLTTGNPAGVGAVGLDGVATPGRRTSP